MSVTIDYTDLGSDAPIVSDQFAESILAFNVGPYTLAAPAETVLAVIEPLPLHVLPVQGNGVVGVINYRDQVARVVSVHQKVGVAGLTNPKAGQFILSRLKDGLTGFWVDMALELINLKNLTVTTDPILLAQTPFHRCLLNDERILFAVDFETLFNIVTPPKPRTVYAASAPKVDSPSIQKNVPDKKIASPDQLKSKDESEASKPIKDFVEAEVVASPSAATEAGSPSIQKSAPEKKVASPVQFESKGRSKAFQPIKDSVKAGVVAPPSATSGKVFQSGGRSSVKPAGVPNPSRRSLSPRHDFYSPVLSEGIGNSSPSSATGRRSVPALKKLLLVAAVLFMLGVIIPAFGPGKWLGIQSEKRSTAPEHSPAAPPFFSSGNNSVYSSDAGSQPGNEQNTLVLSDNSQREIKRSISATSEKLPIKGIGFETAKDFNLDIERPLPAPAPELPPEKTMNPREISYRVVKGDSLWHIARRYLGNPFRYLELAELNRIKNPDRIYPGDIIRIIKK